MRSKKFILIVIAIMLILTGCTDSDSKVKKDSEASSENREGDALRFKNDYESLNGIETSTKGVNYRDVNISSSNPIRYTTFKEVSKKIENKESFILYVGFSSCPWCRSVIPYILEEAKKNDIDTIYYINLREDGTRESDLRGYYKLDKNNKVVYDVYPDEYYHEVLDTLDKFLSSYTLVDKNNNKIETGEKRLYAPSLIVYKNGEAVLLDSCISDKQNDAYQEFTDEITNDIKSKANSLFKLYNSSNSCSIDDNEKGC